MGLSRGSGVSLWRQIAETLTEEIEADAFNPEKRLPTEYALAKRFNVNRHTIRRAIDVLEERGIVRVEQGRGTFIHEDIIDYRVGKRTRFQEIIKRQYREPSGELLSVSERPAPALIARELGLSTGAPLIVIRTLGRADGRPISLAMHHFSGERFPRIGDHYRQTRSVTRALQDSGIADYTRKITRITTRMPDRDEARLLQTSVTRPVLVSEAVNVDGDGNQIEYGVSLLVSDRVQIVVESD